MTTEQSTITCEDETSHAAALNENKESAANGSASNTPRRRRDSIMKQRSSMVGIKDNVKKSVCFSTTPDLRITAADDCFRVMREGTEFIKLRKADRQYLRCFYLTEQQDEVMWYPTKKPSKARLKIDEVREIRVGRNTPLLRTHEFATRYNEDCQFSIVFGEEYESLDLVARTPELANVWIAGLNALLAQRNDARRRNQTSFDAFGSARSNRVSAVSDDFDAIALGAPSSSPPLLSNGDAPHMGNPVCVTNRSLSCPSTALMNRSRKPSEACFCGEPPIGEHDDRLEFEPPVVFELGDTPLRRTSSSSTGEQSQTHSLSQLIDTCSNCAGLRDRWLRETFVRADLQRCGVLRETDALCAMQSAGFDVCPFRLRRKMMELDASKTEEERGQLNVEQFVKLCKELFTRPDVYFLLTRYASNAEYLTFGELIFFLETEQGVKLSRNEVIELIYRFEPTREGKEHLHMGIDGLTSYLLSPDCCVFDTRHYSLCQDMTQPLAHYSISASHNT